MESPPEPSPAASPDRPPSNLAPVVAVGEALLGVIAVALGWFWGIRPGESLDWNYLPWTARLESAAWGVGAALPPLFALRRLLRSRRRSMTDLRTFVERQVAPWFAGSSRFELAVLALAAGVGEELLFRGFLQNAWAASFAPPLGPWIGLAGASLAFGLGHALTKLYFWLATGMGAYLGLLFLLTGDLTAPILTHAIYDYVALVWLVAGRDARTGEASSN